MNDKLYGIILNENDPLNRGRYKVYIPSLQNSKKNKKGIWATNGMSSYVRYRNSSNKTTSVGTYLPLQPGMEVNIKMTGDQAEIISIHNNTTSIPDPNNRDNIYRTTAPDGSSLTMDSNKGYVHLTYKNGASNLTLSDNYAALELNAPGSNGNEFTSRIIVADESITFRIGNSVMEFNESGLAMKFGGGSQYNITKESIELQSEGDLSINAKGTLSLSGRKVHVQGKTEAHIRSPHTRINGAQLLSLKGTQIDIESLITTSVKSLNINLQAEIKMTEVATIKDSKILGTYNINVPIMVESSGVKSTASGSIMESYGIRAMDGQIVSNLGVGSAATSAINSSITTVLTILDTTMGIMGTGFLLKGPGMGLVSTAIVDTFAGSAHPANKPLGSTIGAFDVNDKVSPTTIINDQINYTNTVMEKYTPKPKMVL